MHCVSRPKWVPKIHKKQKEKETEPFADRLQHNEQKRHSQWKQASSQDGKAEREASQPASQLASTQARLTETEEVMLEHRNRLYASACRLPPSVYIHTTTYPQAYSSMRASVHIRTVYMHAGS
jgi:hypothetical protein